MSHLGRCKSVLIRTGLFPPVLFCAAFPLVSLYAASPPKGSRFEKVLKTYTFVADFEPKESAREVAEEIFWKYPFKLPEISFPLKVTFDVIASEFPATEGSGLAIQHVNRGRIFYLDGNYEEARKTWLSARARYGKTYPEHRRTDYFIGLSFIKLAEQEMRSRKVQWEDQMVRGYLDNASTFLSWAFVVKSSDRDPVVDHATPKGLYNLAAIYFNYKRYSNAFKVAERGLNFLRASGRSDFRAGYYRVLAESYILNGSPLEAVQQLDTALRQDASPGEAAAIFARVGDIYFTLNNYELAEDAYKFANDVERDSGAFNPSQLILRAESLFWLKQFSHSQKLIHLALHEGAKAGAAPLTKDFAAYAHLRFADSHLAQKYYDKAKLAYFRATRTYPTTDAATISLIRRACLELPYYKGNNIKHARELLSEAKQNPALTGEPRELSWACEVGSYAQHERTDTMVDRVREFHKSNPNAKFLASLIEPVREVQAGKLGQLLAAGEAYSAISFFEANRKALFPKISDDLARAMFVTYADSFKPEQAVEFWPQYTKKQNADLDLLRQAAVVAEIYPKNKKKWLPLNNQLSNRLVKRQWELNPSDLPRAYTTRILATSVASAHLSWLYNLAEYWATKEPSFTCKMQLPILNRMFASKSPAVFKSKVLGLIDSQISELMKADYDCAVSLLELEYRLLENNPDILASRYQQRMNWELQAAILPVMWSAAETLYKSGRQDQAKSMFKFIAEKGPPGAAEVAFAKMRIDPNRTEFEQLW